MKSLSNEKLQAKIKEKLWLLLLVGIPILQFLLLFVWVKIDSVVLAFQEYTGNPSSEFVFAGMSNFAEVFSSIFVTRELGKMFLNSIKVYLIGFAFFPIHILVAYIIWYKVPLAGAYKVILYLPSILPGMVFTLAYKYFLELGLPVLTANPASGDLLYNPNSAFFALMFYQVFMGLPSGLVIYLGTISGVNESVVEYARLDGLGMFGQLWHIVLPHIFPTVSAFIVAGVCGILTADCGLYSFFGENAPSKLHTIGYHMQVYTLKGKRYYPYLSALGLVITAVAIPITFTVRRLLEKYGPSED